jgi:fluoroacetyl-CoA thioesterase
MEVPVGAQGEVRRRVDPEMTADRWGNPGVVALATPEVVGLCEQAAALAVAPHLGPGETSVGTRVDIRHLAPTPVGMEVRATARVVAVEGRRITLAVEVRDAVEKVAEGTHERVVVPADRFAARLADKAAAAP